MDIHYANRVNDTLGGLDELTSLAVAKIKMANLTHPQILGCHDILNPLPFMICQFYGGFQLKGEECNPSK